MTDENNRFIPGIFNYCDRWCERCPFADRCLVYYRQEITRERHVMRGEDPDDPKIIAQDAAEGFREAMGTVQEMAADWGLDIPETADEAAALRVAGALAADLLDDMDEARAEAEDEQLPPGLRRHQPSYRQSPLYLHTWEWTERVGALLERVHGEIRTLGLDLANAMIARADERDEDIPDDEAQEVVETLTALRDSCELLVRYRFLIPVKLGRALGSLQAAEREPELAGLRMQDANGTARLVEDCLRKSRDAIWQVAEFHREWQDLALPLLAETERLRKDLAARIPGYKTFVRPGFDER